MATGSHLKSVDQVSRCLFHSAQPLEEPCRPGGCSILSEHADALAAVRAITRLGEDLEESLLDPDGPGTYCGCRLPSAVAITALAHRAQAALECLHEYLLPKTGRSRGALAAIRGSAEG